MFSTSFPYIRKIGKGEYAHSVFSITKALIKRLGHGSGGSEETVSGNTPLTLLDAANEAIKKLVRFGATVQNGTPTPDAPIDILCNNGALKYGVLGKNWFGLNASPVSRTYLDSTGGTGASANWTLSDFIAVNPATQYTFNPNSSSGATAKTGYYTAEQTFISAIDSGLQTFTTPNNCFFMRFSYRNESSNIQLEVGSTATDFEQYKGKGIVADGTPEVLTVGGVNLFDPNYYSGEGWYISNSKQVANAASNGTLVFPCKPNTTYSWWHTDGKGGERAFELTTDTVTVGQAETWAVGNPAYNDAMTVRKYTTSANAKLLCVLFARVDAEKVGRTKDEQLADFMLVEGDVGEAFAYEPYIEPQTASAENLFAIEDYKDEQDIISGSVTHKIGYHIFDGTETFSKSTAYGKAFLINAASSAWGADRTQAVLCTHFLGLPQTKSQQEDNTCFFNQTGHFYFRVTDNSDADAFKSWLATQYAVGTPVIVFYVLAEETSEAVTAQPLSTNKGTNVVSVTSEIGTSVPAECVYVKKQGQATPIVGTAKVGSAKVE